MKRALPVIFALLVPALLALGVREANRMNDMIARLDGLVAEQEALVEKNRGLIASIATMESRARVDRAARERLGMERGGPERRLVVRPAPPGKRKDG